MPQTGRSGERVGKSFGLLRTTMVLADADRASGTRARKDTQGCTQANGSLLECYVSTPRGFQDSRWTPPDFPGAHRSHRSLIAIALCLLLHSIFAITPLDFIDYGRGLS